IETLPRDIVWEIIKEIPESVCALRLTSRTIKSFVDEFVLQGAVIPLVDEVQFNFKVIYQIMEIEIYVRKRFTYLLELRLKLRQLSSKIIVRNEGI
ncbi:hypothetical protein PMAYCL1PPCAC_20197, partial [Pristionchus mayeri]